MDTIARGLCALVPTRSPEAHRQLHDIFPDFSSDEMGTIANSFVDSDSSAQKEQAVAGAKFAVDMALSASLSNPKDFKKIEAALEGIAGIAAARTKTGQTEDGNAKSAELSANENETENGNATTDESTTHQDSALVSACVQFQSLVAGAIVKTARAASLPAEAVPFLPSAAAGSSAGSSAGKKPVARKGPISVARAPPFCATDAVRLFRLLVATVFCKTAPLLPECMSQDKPAGAVLTALARLFFTATVLAPKHDSEKLVGQLLRCVFRHLGPVHAQHYLSLLLQVAAADAPEIAGFVGAIAATALSSPSPSDDSARVSVVVDWFVQRVLAAPAPHPVGALSAWRVWLGRLPEETFISTILPAVGRSLLRSPEVSIPVAASTLSAAPAVSIVAAVITDAVVPSLLQSARTADDVLRHTALDAWMSCVRCAESSTQALGALSQAVADAIKQRPRQWYERRAMVEAAAAICDAALNVKDESKPVRLATRESGKTVCAALMRSIDGDSHDETRLRSFEVLGRWVVVGADSSAQDFLLKQLESTQNSLRRAASHGLLAMLAAMRALSQPIQLEIQRLAPISSHVVKTVQNAKTLDDPSLLSSLAGIAVIVQLQDALQSFDSFAEITVELTKPKFPLLTMTASNISEARAVSLFFHKHFKTDEYAQRALVALCESMLMRGAIADPLSALAFTTVLLLLSPYKSVRVRIHKEVRSANATTQATLLNSLWSLLDMLGEFSPAGDPFWTASRISQAALSCATAPGFSGASAALALMCVNHPLAAPSAAMARNLSKYLLSAVAIGEDLRTLEEASAYLLPSADSEPTGCNVSSSPGSIAAARAVGGLAIHSVSSYGVSVILRCRAQLEKLVSDLNTLSANETKLLLTDPATVYDYSSVAAAVDEWRTTEHKKLDAEVARATSTREHGAFADTAADRVWNAEMRSSVYAKHNARLLEEEARVRHRAIEEQLHRESIVRQRFVAPLSRCRCRLTAFASALRSSAFARILFASGHSGVSTIETIHRCIVHPLFREQALSAHFAAANGLDQRFVLHASEFARLSPQKIRGQLATGCALTKLFETYVDAPLQSSVRLIERPVIPPYVADLVQYLAGALKRPEFLDYAIPASTFCFVFPLLQYSLLHGDRSYDMATEDAAISVLATHARAIGGGAGSEQTDIAALPRASIVRVLVAAIPSLPIQFGARCAANLRLMAPGISCHVENGVDAFELAELLQGLSSSSLAVRASALLALSSTALFTNSSQPEPSALRTQQLWFVAHDDNAFPEVAGQNIDKPLSLFAMDLWSQYGHELPSSSVDALYFPMFERFLRRPHEDVRLIASRSVAHALKLHPTTFVDLMRRCIGLYESSLPRPFDRFAHPNVSPEELDAMVAEHAGDSFPRLGVASMFLSFAKLSVEPGEVVFGMDVSVIGDSVSSIVKFLLEVGLADPDEDVRDGMMAAGEALMACKAIASDPTISAKLLAPLEAVFDKPAQSEEDDRIRAAAVVFMGALARHMAKGDAKVNAIVVRLLDALATPSESVQRGVARCLSAIVPKIADEQAVGAYIADIIDRLFAGTEKTPTYAARRGAAYGLAGLAKGAGLSSLKKYDITTQLQNGVSNRKSSNARLGSLLAFETLSVTLGRLFEPHVMQILPKLLECFGDKVADVREAAFDSSRAIMSKLSAHGVKLVLPILLKGLDQRNWRAKKGSIDVLGSMAFCAPRQLSACLPQIVPKLQLVLTDTHDEVQESARAALRHVGDVIRNPELQQHVPILLAALDDPDEAAGAKISLTGATPLMLALDALMHTSFIHVIDAPSLSLILPLLHEGLKQRSVEVKKRAATIVGNMCSLAALKDLQPYLPQLVEDLKLVTLDPIPEARAVAARSLGALIRGVARASNPASADLKESEELTEVSAEVHDLVQSLIPWCLTTMRGSGKNSGSVERAGAAQALAEAAAVMPVSFLTAEILPPLMKDLAGAGSAGAREGATALFVFLPGALGTRFEPFLGEVLPAVLRGLSDDSDTVRDMALRAAQAIVNEYALLSRVSRAYLIPVLLGGIGGSTDFTEGVVGDDIGSRIAELAAAHTGDWRFREAAVQLLGDLLSRIVGGVAAQRLAQAQADQLSEKQQAAVEQAVRNNPETTLDEFLGTTVRNIVFVQVFITRHDVVMRVRQAASGVWKQNVGATGRVLADILDRLLRRIIFFLGSPAQDTRNMGASCLADVVDRLGAAKLLPELLPLLRELLSDPNSASSSRHGVCAALTETMQATSKAVIQSLEEKLVPAIRDVLSDDHPEVREAGGAAFDTLYLSLGAPALSSVLPPLLAALEPASANEAGVTLVTTTQALNALKQILAVRADVVLPFLVPKLLSPPVTAFNVRALASVAEVAGSALIPHLPVLLPVLVQELAALESSSASPEDNAAIRAAAESIVEAASDSASVASREAVQPTEGRGRKTREKGAIAPDLVIVAELVKLLANGSGSAVAEGARLSDTGRRRIILERAQAATLIKAFVKAAGQLLGDAAEQQLIRALVAAMADDSPIVNAEAHAALTELITSCVSKDKDSQVVVMAYLWQQLDQVRTQILIPRGGEDESLPAFANPNVPKPLAPFLPLFTTALLSGAADVRESAARGLEGLVRMTPAEQLKAFVIPITGPLIRVVGDRFPSAVKVAILATLRALLDRGGVMLRPFVPQLQTTFVKALQDPASAETRTAAALALGRLVPLSVRLDPLVAELTSAAIKNLSGEGDTDSAVSPDVGQAIILALSNVMDAVGGKLSETAQEKLRQLLFAGIPLGTDSESVMISSSHAEDLARGEGAGVREQLAYSVAIASFVINVVSSEDTARDIVRSLLSGAADLHGGTSASESTAAAAGVAIRLRCLRSLQLILKQRSAVATGLESVLARTLVLIAVGADGTSDSVLRDAAVRALGRVLEKFGSTLSLNDANTLDFVVTELSEKAIIDSDPMVRTSAALAVKLFAKAHPSVVRSEIQLMVPALLAACKNRSYMPGQKAAERALYWVLQIPFHVSSAAGLPPVLQEYVSGAGGTPVTKQVVELAQKVLMRFAESDEE